MIGIFLAILSALAYSSSAVLVRKRLIESNYFSAARAVTITVNIILWPLAFLFVDPRRTVLQGVLLFVIAGILAGISSILYYKGMEILGVSINASILSTYPMYSSILAVFLLGETITPEHWIGIVCIIAGVIFVERHAENFKSESKIFSKKSLFFPLLATLTVAFSYIVRKSGLIMYNEPLLDAAMEQFSAAVLLLLLSLTFSFGTQRPKHLKKEIRVFWKAGVCQAFGWILASYALSHEQVSIVTPIIQTKPLFILLLSYLYLTGLERISLKVIIGTILIVTGVILISMQ